MGNQGIATIFEIAGAYLNGDAVKILLEHNDTVPIPEETLAAVARDCDFATMEMMLKHGGRITLKILVAAMKARDDSRQLMRLLLQHGTALRSTIAR